MSGNMFDIVLKGAFDESAVLDSIRQGMKELRESEVLIGIPEEANEIHPGQDISITNAELLYVHTHGSPINGIPPRDVLDSSIKHNADKISLVMEKAVQAALDGKSENIHPELEKAGLFAENQAKAWFTNPANGWAPNLPATIKAKGSDRPLIDTGELRKSITFVLRKKGETKR